MNKLLRILTAIFAVATALLGFAHYAELLPREYAAIVGLITAVLLGIKEIVVVIGDIADDGVRNNSYKPDAALKQWTGLLVLGSLLLASGCSFFTRHQAVIEGVLIEEARRLVPSAKQPLPRTVVPRSLRGSAAGGSESDRLKPGLHNSPECEEPGECAVPRCLRVASASH